MRFDHHSVVTTISLYTTGKIYKMNAGFFVLKGCLLLLCLCYLVKLGKHTGKIKGDPSVWPISYGITVTVFPSIRKCTDPVASNIFNS